MALCRTGAVRFGGLALLVLLGAGAAPAAAEEPPCQGAPLQFPAERRDRLRRHRSLAAFARWRLVELELPPCAQGEVVDARFWWAPPPDGIRTRVTYLLAVPALLDLRTGEPTGVKDRELAQLALSARRLIGLAEEDEDVQHFVERYPPERAQVVPPDAAGPLRVEYLAGSRPDAPAPRMVWSELPANGNGRGAPKAGIVAYEIPRMDGFPARRELLKFLEALSRAHPFCRPSWIRVRREASPAGNGPFTWAIEASLEGEACPASLKRFVTSDRRVLEAIEAPTAP